MKLLYLLESLRTPAGDWLMSGITHLGGETAFLAVATSSSGASTNTRDIIC